MQETEFTVENWCTNLFISFYFLYINCLVKHAFVFKVLSPKVKLSQSLCRSFYGTRRLTFYFLIYLQTNDWQCIIFRRESKTYYSRCLCSDQTLSSLKIRWVRLHEYLIILYHYFIPVVTVSIYHIGFMCYWSLWRKTGA